MSRLARYWILFAIVAVGLAISWGQMGHEAERVLRNEPLVFLATEQGCQPRAKPCAAVAADRALVLGPDRSGLRVEQAGLTRGDIVQAEAVFLAADGSTMDSRVLTRDVAVWLVSEIPTGAASLRVQIVSKHDRTVAEFPL